MDHYQHNSYSPQTAEDGTPFGLSIEVSPPDDRPPTTMTSDGKRKRVGFTSDTTPPSPDLEAIEQRHLGDVVRTPDDAFAGQSSSQVSPFFTY